MMTLTDKEFSRIDFLYRYGVSDDEIVDDIVSSRPGGEADIGTEVSEYIQYVLDTAL